MNLFRLALASVISLVIPLGARAGWACGGGMLAHPAAFPGDGNGISPQSSLFVVSAQPAGLTLKVNGVAAQLPAVTDMGWGVAADGLGYFSRIAGPLQPSSDYLLESTGSDGVAHTLTQFQTAASYDKAPGTAATITNLRLWRVHYPKRLVNAGGCVGSEYEGYFALDFTPATIPGTPAAEVVSVLSLDAPELGTSQQFVFTGGVTTLPGGLTTAISGDGVMLPDGGALSAGAALWHPNLEPGRTYCATIVSYGRNDLAAGPASSASNCVVAVAIEYPGADMTGGAAGAGGGGAAGARCDTGQSAAGGAPAGTGGSPYPIADNSGEKPTGCSYAETPAGTAGAALVGIVLAGLRARRRRCRSDV